MIVNENLDSLLIAEKEKFQKEFLEKIDINIFKQEEEDWIIKNLDFIYSNNKKDATLKINPYCRFIEKVILTEDNSSIRKNYILLPKYLALDRLHVHIGEIDKADKMIKLMANYKYQFPLSEIVSVIIDSCTPDKREIMEIKINTIIRKFLSYQYLVII